MKKRRPAAPASMFDETTRTGHHCPKAGWWSVAGHPSDARFVTKGEVMPAWSGAPAQWILRETEGDQHLQAGQSKFAGLR